MSNGSGPPKKSEGLAPWFFCLATTPNAARGPDQAQRQQYEGRSFGTIKLTWPGIDTVSTW